MSPAAGRSPPDALALPGPLRAWAMAVRPATLPVSIAPVLAGAALAFADGARGKTELVGLAALGAVLLQVTANLANDVFDFERGADNADRVGPVRVTQAGLLSPGAVRTGVIVTLTLALAVGVLLAQAGGWPIVALGLAAMVSAVAYTGGPFPLGYHGLGDAFVFAFFGPVAVGTTVWLAGGPLGLDALLVATSMGSLATAVLVVNNIRDEATDRVAAKRTLVVRFGGRFGRAQYGALLATAFGGVVALAVHRGALSAALPLLACPLGARCFHGVSRRSGRALNPYLGATARLILAVALLLTLGFAVSTRT